MELDTVDRHRDAFYRLLGSDATDEMLEEHGEAANEIVDLCLTRGSRTSQRFMLDNGYNGWRSRDEITSWSGADAADGGRYTALPDDFLKAYGNERMSALRKANGDQWGRQVEPNEAHLKGNYYYIRGDELWLARAAVVPTTLYLEYHYTHPKWENLADGAIDFPIDARWLIIAEGANAGKDENWIPAGIEMEAKITRALASARDQARAVARPTKAPRKMKAPRRVGNHW